MRKLVDSCSCLVEEGFPCPPFKVTSSHKLSKMDSEALGAILLSKTFYFKQLFLVCIEALHYSLKISPKWNGPTNPDIMYLECGG